MEKIHKEDNKMLKALEAIQTENQKLQSSLQEIGHTRKSLEVSFDSSEKQLSTLLQEEYKLQAIHAINLMKIQTVEKEINQFEEKLKAIEEIIQTTREKIKDYKNNSDIKINNFMRDAQYLCKHFLSAVHIETDESDSLKIFDEMYKLKLEIARKEEAVVKIKRELEDFVFFGFHDTSIESFVTLEEREILMNEIENQYLNVTRELEELDHLKSEKQIEEFHWAREYKYSN